MQSNNPGFNRHNNQAMLMEFEERNQLADQFLKGLETELLTCTHFIIDYIISAPGGRPRVIEGELKQLSDEQFGKLYHAISWSLAGLFCSRQKGFLEQLVVLHSSVIAPLGHSSSKDFVTAVNSVFGAGGFDFMGLKLFERIKDVLLLPEESPAGGFVLIKLLTACIQKLES